jgi:regulatory protein
MEIWNRAKALQKIGKYCAYQDRCHAEVRQKLRDMGAPWEEAEEILVQLILDGFLDEERFAKAFVRGKFRNNGWGRIRIKMELKAREIGEKVVEKALKTEIDPLEYHQTALGLLRKKWQQLRDPDDFIRNRKAEAYLQQKGFEWDAIRNAMDDWQEERKGMA